MFIAPTPTTQLPVLLNPEASDVFPCVDMTTNMLAQLSIGTLNQFFSGQFINSNIVSALVATTGNLNAVYLNGVSGVGATLTNAGTLAAITIDGVSLDIGDRVLVAQQSITYENGVYSVTTIGDSGNPWVLTRVTDYDGHLSNQIQQGDFIGITSGATYSLTFWFMISPTPLVIGTDAIIFNQSVATPSRETWNIINSTSQVMLPNQGYIANTATLCTLTLPSVCSIGDKVQIIGREIGLFQIAQNASQNIVYGNVSTTVGVTGYLQSTATGDSLTLVCTQNNTEFTVLGAPQGASLTYV